MNDVTERRAIFIYEAARIAAIAAMAPVIPLKWEHREKEFKAQFREVIDKQCGLDRKMFPDELHDDWVRAYEKMGWSYGEVYDPEHKTHPDMVPYPKLGQLEKDKDDVFILLCELARIYIR